MRPFQKASSSWTGFVLVSMAVHAGCVGIATWSAASRVEGTTTERATTAEAAVSLAGNSPLAVEGMALDELLPDAPSTSEAPAESDRAATYDSAATAEATAPPADLGDIDAPSAPSSPRRRSRRAAVALRGGVGETGAPPTFGATGDRAATDLVSAFARALPIASSSDGRWSQASLGSLGRVNLELVIDPSGQLAAHRASLAESGSSTIGTQALLGGVARTIALLRHRAFVSRGATTKLLLSGRITADRVPDGLHGDVFAIGASYTFPTGHAFFALAIGRRIDVEIRAQAGR